jgi:hypothetical protein
LTPATTLLAIAAAALAVCACGGGEAADVGTTTPTAASDPVLSRFGLTIGGEVAMERRFDAADLSELPATNLRTRELTRDGDYLGAYAYTGVSLRHLLQTVEPRKQSAGFQRPLDMLVTATDAGGRRAHFSYGEIAMADDANPILLAYRREPVVPIKSAESYTGNKLTQALEGLRLVCPGDLNVDRYLDQVVTLRLTTPEVSLEGLPASRKGHRCSSDSILRCTEQGCMPAELEGLEQRTVRDWVRVGHGRGFKGISSASGDSLVSFLEHNFPDHCLSRFYLFIACDGYRSLFSGTEIFETAKGRRSLIITELDGKPPHGGLTLGPVGDYFVDRDVWGLSHVVQLEP